MHKSIHEWSHRAAEYLHAFPDDHPSQIALRTYALAISLALGPSAAGFVMKPRWKRIQPLLGVIRRELGPTGFAFAITVAVAGGASAKSLLDYLERKVREKFPKVHLPRIGDIKKMFFANALSATIAILLMHRRLPRSGAASRELGKTQSKSSPTLDLTLLVFVRAMDAVMRGVFFPPIKRDQSNPTLDEHARERVVARRRKLAARFDAFLFWAASARIMWCFFYEPQRLPKSYNTWIMKLANIDPRILGALRALREGRWSYITGLSNPPDLVSSLSRDLGYPSAWGDPASLPAYGGPSATETWKALGVKNRAALGGLPCELVHGGLGGGSCTGNALIRGALAFVEAMLIYVPVHMLPILLTRPQKLTKASNILNTLLSAIRSASFLSSFVSSIWVSVCLTRTLALARLMPWISHEFWDGPHGCAFLGALVCGSTIWIEQGKRRGEMALYVLPRAVRACLPETLAASRRRMRLLERLVFATSLATLLTAFTHKPETLRGLSRWTLSFVMSGPNVGFWKKKRQDSDDTLAPTASSSHR